MTYFLCLQPTAAPFCWHEPRDGLIEVPGEQSAAYRELKHLYRECNEQGAPLDGLPKPVQKPKLTEVTTDAVEELRAAKHKSSKKG
jgi:hypothetical protein